MWWIKRILLDPASPRKLQLLAVTNLLATLYWVSCTTAITMVSLCDIVPYVYAGSPRLLWIHYFTVIFFLVNVVGNAVNVMRTDTTISRLDMDNVDRSLLPGRCKVCNKSTPNRSHHCPLCGTCILKRDHHCFFLSTCVGYHNHRYFALFCLYQAAAGVYGALLVAVRLHHLYHVRFSGAIHMVTMLPKTLLDWWFLGTVATYQLFLTGLFFTCLLSGTAAAGLGFWQLWLIINGQTTYEATCDDYTYTHSISQNFIEVFGPKWYLSILLPLATPMAHNGVYSIAQDGSMNQNEHFLRSIGSEEKRLIGQLILTKMRGKKSRRRR